MDNNCNFSHKLCELDGSSIPKDANMTSAQLLNHLEKILDDWKKSKFFYFSESNKEILIELFDRIESLQNI